MGDGHGVSFLTGHDLHTRELLDQIGTGTVSSQRRLARELGIALGLTNLLLRRTVTRGWVRVVRLTQTRVRYALTPAGAAEKARMTRRYLEDSVRFYMTARDRIRESLPAASAGSKRIVFYGCGEVAEIAYVCLQHTDLQLVGVVGPPGRQRFFGFDVQADDCLHDGFLGDIPFDRLVVTSFDDRAATEARLKALGISSVHVHWL